jgi:uncharacterized protein YegL
MHRYLFAWAILFLTSTVAIAQTAPPLVRAIVLDTSGSMAGERIGTAKAEILAMARQLPPSKDRPIVLIPFHEVPHSVRTFTDLPSFEAHIAKLNADGGTSIASGLNRALEEIKTFGKTSQLCLLLYSDGEDDDTAGIEAAEKKLDALFAARGKQNLQSLVFCKRWENANAKLLTNLTKSGNAKVIDAGQLKVVPATLTPTVKVLRAAWGKIKPLTLEIECQARIELSGIPFDPSFPTTTLQCTDPGAVLKPTVLRPGDPKPTIFTVQIPLPASAPAAGNATVHFALGSTGQLTLKNGIALPQLTASQLAIPVALPPLAFDLKLSATLTTAKPPTWSDPLKGKPIQHLTLTCSIAGGPDLPWPQPLTLRLKPESCRLLSGKDTFTFHGPGTLTLPVSLEADSTAASASTFSVALVIQPDPPAGFAVDPPELRLTKDSALPPPVETNITAQVQSVSEACWDDLVQGLGSFYADVTFDVIGPIPPATEVTLLCPPTVRKVAVTPAVLVPGTQTLRITIQAQFPAAPKTAQFDIKIQPPAAAGAVRFAAPPPLRLQPPAPAPVQLALLGSTGASPQVTVYDPTAPVLLMGTPTLLNQGPTQKPGGITAVVRVGPLFGSQGTEPVPLDTPLTLQLKLPYTETSFFFDTTIEEDIEVIPGQSSPALVGSCQRCTVTVEARFKRVFFYLAGVLAAIVVVFLIVRVTLPVPPPSSSTDSSRGPLETYS